MRQLKFFALVSIFLSSNIALHSEATSTFFQVNPDQSMPSNYVVIGAFAIQNNALKFTSYAKRLNYQAQFEMNYNRNLYYVYVLNTQDRDEAMNEAKRLREETQFIDTWVYNGSFTTEVNNNTVAFNGADINPASASMQSVETTEVSNPTATNETISSTISTASSANDEATSGKSFLFQLKRAIDNKSVEGDVDVIDPDKSRKLASYKGNTPVKISQPENQSQELTFVCEVFGYRKMQRDINYSNPEGEGISTDNNSTITVIPFELIRLQKGDIAVMYNVYFFKDAAVMRPESRYEVNSLLEMLNENPKYQIKIHGHTNGNAAGKIISMGDGGDFFSLSNTKDGIGSAKKLSEQRANIIRNYLVANGIDPKRMVVKAWGGKRPVHDKNSNRAQENVRVEIEIVEDK